MKRIPLNECEDVKLLRNAVTVLLKAYLFSDGHMPSGIMHKVLACIDPATLEILVPGDTVTVSRTLLGEVLATAAAAGRFVRPGMFAEMAKELEGQ
jgi:hypothetical protein